MPTFDSYLDRMYIFSGLSPDNNNYQNKIQTQYNSGDLIYGFNYQVNSYINNVPYFKSASKFQQASVISQYKLNWTEYGINPQIKIATPRQTRSFIDNILKNNKYKEVLSSEDLGFDNYGLSSLEKYETKKSKAGLSWAKESGNRIHYILDDINLNFAIKKIDMYDVDGETRISTTNSELRWLYRNRNDADVQKSVQFWKNGRPANAPWADDPEMWSQYKPRSETSILKITQHNKNRNFTRRRESYHDAILCEI